MKYKAVIFDLFGTLVDNMHHEAFVRVLEQMCACLQVSTEAFTPIWNKEIWPLRATGELPVPAAIAYICRLLGAHPTPEQVRQAVNLRYEFIRNMLVPRPETIATLTVLKTAGYQLGLVSDCTEDTAHIWPQTPMAELIDATILSCEVGLKKPDPRIFQLACERLNVEPEHCLYMGDGGSNELRGACSVGMYPVLIRVPYENAHNTQRHDEEQWDGPRISSVSEILIHVDRALVV